MVHESKSLSISLLARSLAHSLGRHAHPNTNKHEKRAAAAAAVASNSQQPHSSNNKTAYRKLLHIIRNDEQKTHTYKCVSMNEKKTLQQYENNWTVLL